LSAGRSAVLVAMGVSPRAGRDSGVVLGGFAPGAWLERGYEERRKK
jgi:hypothetical protein